MKFYDLEWLAKKCGTDNKYEITAKIAAEARRESEEEVRAKDNENDNENPVNELFISKVLAEIEEDKSPVSVDYIPPMPAPEFDFEPEYVNRVPKAEVKEDEDESENSDEENEEKNKTKKFEFEATPDEDETDETEEKPAEKSEEEISNE